jgi:hypothetical protein
MKKLTTTVTAVCVVLMIFAGCYGPFKLTKKVYEWNGSLPNPWGREALFLVMNILPVYGLSLFADAVFFNLVEFWGGNNPISTAGNTKARVISSGDKSAVMTFASGSRKVRVDVFNKYRPQNCFIFEPVDAHTVIARDDTGKVLMTAKTLDDGSVFVQDGTGREIACQLPEGVQ